MNKWIKIRLTHWCKGTISYGDEHHMLVWVCEWQSVWRWTWQAEVILLLMLALDQVQILYSRHSNKEAVTAVSVSANWEEKKKKKRALFFIYVPTKKIWPMKSKFTSKINKRTVSDSTRPRQCNLKQHSLHKSPPKHLSGLQHWPTAHVYRLFSF